ncbi:DUF7523 family protein [Salinigranum salinum]|uniref:DUF7523 family protein n=1 Tax=Salinigranum salinum TaxID=1364937 RepID=UPI00126045FB|nr:hypothetical protein [Salinigranum salinum]
MSLAAEAREAVRSEPFLHRALAAGVVNYRAAADYLALDGDADAVATALRRYAEELDPPSTHNCGAPVRMQSGVGLADPVDDVGDGDSTEPFAVEETADLVVAVGDRWIVRGGEMTAVRARGDVDARALGSVLSRLDAASVVVDAAGVVGGELVVVVPRRQGGTALQVVEAALESVPE